MNSRICGKDYQIMSSFILSCCSTADLSKEHFERRDIKYICFHYMLDDKEYLDDLGQTMSSEEFYKKMEEGAMTRTSQVNVEEYIEYFTPFLEEGKDILHLSLSSGISGSYKSAESAASYLAEKYPERKIYIVDSLAAASGFGLLMDLLADERDKGADIDACRAWAEENKLNLHHWFFSTDLKYFVRGGRISKLSGFLGGIMDICPLLNVDKEGHLKPIAKLRTKKKVMRAIVERMEQNAIDGLDYSGKCYMCHSAFYDEARQIADVIEEKFKNLDGKVLINNIGTTIGSHTGPGTVALFFMGKSRAEEA